MATDFAMPVQQYTASPSQYALYNPQSRQISPTSSATATPSNSSPTSPRTGAPALLPSHTRQLRPPKSPLYIPAVLRPTDPPKRAAKSPLTPPASIHNSIDSLENARTHSRRLTGDSGKFDLGSITETEYSTEGLGKVTALPTREHWKVRLADAPVFRILCFGENPPESFSIVAPSSERGVYLLYSSPGPWYSTLTGIVVQYPDGDCVLE